MTRRPVFRLLHDFKIGWRQELAVEAPWQTWQSSASGKFYPPALPHQVIECASRVPKFKSDAPGMVAIGVADPPEVAVIRAAAPSDESVTVG